MLTTRVTGTFENEVYRKDKMTHIQSWLCVKIFPLFPFCFLVLRSLCFYSGPFEASSFRPSQTWFARCHRWDWVSTLQRCRSWTLGPNLVVPLVCDTFPALPGTAVRRLASHWNFNQRQRAHSAIIINKNGCETYFIFPISVSLNFKFFCCIISWFTFFLCSFKPSTSSLKHISFGIFISSPMTSRCVVYLQEIHFPVTVSI